MPDPAPLTVGSVDLDGFRRLGKCDPSRQGLGGGVGPPPLTLRLFLLSRTGIHLAAYVMSQQRDHSVCVGARALLCSALLLPRAAMHSASRQRGCIVLLYVVCSPGAGATPGTPHPGDLLLFYPSLGGERLSVY